MADADPHRAPVRADLPPGGRPFRFTIADYMRIGELGIFEGRQVELVDGEIRELNSVHNPHRRVQTELLLALARVLPKTQVILEPNFGVGDYTAREPDLAVVTTTRPPRRSHFRVEEMLIAIEVADSSIGEDLGEKLRFYAEAGVPRYWVVDVNEEVIHDFTEPDGPRYARARLVRFGEPLSLEPVVAETVTLEPGIGAER